VADKGTELFEGSESQSYGYGYGTKVFVYKGIFEPGLRLRHQCIRLQITMGWVYQSQSYGYGYGYGCDIKVSEYN
jgi:hypothetical protein